MESPWDELILSFSRTSMFPFFDIAHYLVSVMALKREPGAVTVACKNPLSSWFTAMLRCFGGGILSCILLAEPPLRFLANNTNILLASSIWYIIFFCPSDLVCQAYSFQPVQLLAAGMKEVTRTWKIVGGVTHANSYYKNGWLVMIAIGWARGAGGSIITTFEQLIKGTWKREADDWLKMSYPSKITLLGSVMFTFQHTKHLAISKHNLMFFYTIFIVATKTKWGSVEIIDIAPSAPAGGVPCVGCHELRVAMMLTQTSIVPFAPFEDALGRVLFGSQQLSSSSAKKSETKFNGTGSSTSKPTAEASDNLQKKHSKTE